MEKKKHCHFFFSSKQGGHLLDRVSCQRTRGTQYKTYQVYVSRLGRSHC